MDNDDRFAAVSTLFAAHKRDVARFARNRVGADGAPDVVQETFLRAMRHESPQTLDKAWLLRTARNIIGDLYRGRKRQQQMLEWLTDSARTATTGESEVAHALADLAPGDREILTMVHWDGLSAGEIAAVLHISEHAAHKRRQRAHDRLRAHLNIQSPLRRVEVTDLVLE